MLRMYQKDKIQYKIEHWQSERIIVADRRGAVRAIFFGQKGKFPYSLFILTFTSIMILIYIGNYYQ